MRIERHVFGSYKGYTTLARSAGVSAEDARILEGGVYGFGQTEDRQYAKSLRSSPAYFTRVLPGRRGLTRVFEGELDADGRPTNLMITAILKNSDWDGGLYGDIAQLLNDKQIWDWSEIAALERMYSAPAASIARKSAGKIISVMAEIEKRAAAPSPIILAADALSDEEMRALEMLIPPKNRPQFTSACRTLSPQLAVTINRLAAQAPLQQITFRPDPHALPSAYGEFLLLHGLGDGELPIGEVMTYRDFGIPPRKARPVRREYVPPPIPAVSQRDPWVIWTAIGAAALAILGSAFIALREHQTARPLMQHSSAASEPARGGVTRGQLQAVFDTHPDLKMEPPRTAPTPIAPAPSTLAVSSPPRPPGISMESEQDRDLARLEVQWDEFVGVIHDQSLEFDPQQRKMLQELRLQMQRDHLLHRVQMGREGTIAALPLMPELHEEYVHVNSLLSDPRLKDAAKLQTAVEQLEITEQTVRQIFSSVSNQARGNNRTFFRIDSTIFQAKERLREMQ